MAWPPIIPPNTRTNIDPQQDNHPADHNLIANAFTDTVAHLTPSAENVTINPVWSGVSTVRRVGWIILFNFNLTRASTTANGPFTMGTIWAIAAPSVGTQYGVVHAHQASGSNFAVANVMSVATDGTISILYKIENCTTLRGQMTWISPPP